MTENAFRELIAPYGGRIAIDIGTGDGLFVYYSALNDSDTFFIGIDPNVKGLQSISKKIARKSARGGLPNALYLRASAQDLPHELSGLGRRIHVNFPWGSLLGAILGSAPGLREIRTICHPEGNLQSIISLDMEKDQSEMERLGLQIGSLESVRSLLTGLYASAGWKLHTEICSTMPVVRTSWGQKLRQNQNRVFLEITAWPITKESEP